jgi:1-acyl-sn-glycerol-3-phosphate acyltransferase
MIRSDTPNQLFEKYNFLFSTFNHPKRSSRNPQKPHFVATMNETKEPFLKFARLWERFINMFKSLIYTLILLVVFLIVTVFAALVSIFKPSEKANVNYYSGRLLAAIMTPILGLRWKIINEDIGDTVGRPCIFVANHQSALDVLCMSKVVPLRTVVMAKKQIKYLPFVGQYFLLASNFLVDRKNHESALRTMANICDEMKKKGLALWIFPEGTRSHARNPELCTRLIP